MSREMTVLGERISLSNDYKYIDELKFSKRNPRVDACLRGVKDFDDLPEEQQQEIIFEKMKEEPSVKNHLREIERHGGLMEPILVRRDTMEVIEGNSRLAVYYMLRDKYKDDKKVENWELIPCDLVSSLTDDQQAAFLNQIHVKGKTQWSAYAKANFAYVRKEDGKTDKEIAELFGESATTIRSRIKVIEMMMENEDNEWSHFSYYDVLVRYSKEVNESIEKYEGLKGMLLKQIKELGTDDEDGNDFTAQDLRRKLPVILKKPKVLKKYKDGENSLDQAYERAKVDAVTSKVVLAHDHLQDISKSAVSELDKGEFGSFKQAVRKLKKQALVRVENIIQEIDKE